MCVARSIEHMPNSHIFSQGFCLYLRIVLLTVLLHYSFSSYSVLMLEKNSEKCAELAETLLHVRA